MSDIEIIRAWKDEEYRSSLSAAERARLPQHPAGLVELELSELDAAAGGTWTPMITFTFPDLCTFLCPTMGGRGEDLRPIGG